MRWSSLVLLFASAIAAAPARADLDIPVPGFCTSSNSVTEVLANAVTDRVYVHCGTTLVEIDTATQAQRSIAVTGRLRLVDPIRNRVIAAPSLVSGSLEFVDVESWSVATHATGLVTNLALDPNDGALWFGRGTTPSTGELWRLDAAGGTPTVLPLPGQPAGVALDAQRGLVHVAIHPRSVVEVDADTLATRTLELPSSVASVSGLLVDPLRERLFVASLSTSGAPAAEFVDTGPLAHLSSLPWPGAQPPGAMTPVLAIDPGYDRLWVLSSMSTRT